MSRYDSEFDTEWDSLDKDEATTRAYAIGVAERLGEFNRETLEAIYAEMDSAYHRSMVELAYEEGRNEAKERAASTDGDGDASEERPRDGGVDEPRIGVGEVTL